MNKIKIFSAICAVVMMASCSSDGETVLNQQNNASISRTMLA